MDYGKHVIDPNYVMITIFEAALSCSKCPYFWMSVYLCFLVTVVIVVIKLILVTVVTVVTIVIVVTVVTDLT